MPQTITKFHELCAPMKDGDGNQQNWCAYDKDKHGLYYLLNGDRYVLGNLTYGLGLKTSEFYFVTEADCHCNAAKYYSNHGKPYPYNKEWRASLTELPVTTNNPDIIESQVMEFE